MPDAIMKRVCAEPEGEIVVFLIGMRINKPWKAWKWLPVLMAMPRMLRELASRPELGLLHARGHFGFRNQMVVQYWRSFEHLQAYAHASDHEHIPSWKAFYRAVGTRGDVGIWHETYVVPANRVESIYINMPRFGLGFAGALLPADGDRASAARRLAAVSPAA